MVTSAGDRLATSVSRLRRYTWWNFAVVVVVIALLPIAPLTTEDLPAWRIAVLSILLALATVQHARLLRDAVAEPGRGVRAPWWAASGAMAALVAAALAAEFMVVWALPAAGMAGALAVAQRPGARWRVVAAAAVLTAGCVALGAAPAPDTGPAVAAARAFGIVLLVGMADVAQIWIWEVALRLDAARRTESDLAVARERLRFAADLHDLQGHHLQVIALKGELVSRLVGTDDATARAEAEQIGEIARTALADTREVVAGYRRASLDTEIGNAVGILQAAGIETEVHGSAGEVPAELQPLFGALVREGTTNVLRHSIARHAGLWVDAGGVRLRNDGARGGRGEGGSGIAGLCDRFAAAGGTVHGGPADEDGSFELVGTA